MSPSPKNLKSGCEPTARLVNCCVNSTKREPLQGMNSQGDLSIDI